jgi:hypothetical protein
MTKNSYEESFEKLNHYVMWWSKLQMANSTKNISPIVRPPANRFHRHGT